MKVDKINHNGLLWEKISKPTKKQLYNKLDTYGFHELHVKACLPPIQRSRLESCEHYLFMILTFPIFDKKNRRMQHVEIDFFINKDYIVTIQDRPYPALDDLFKKLKAEAKERGSVFTGNPGVLLYEIVNACLSYSFTLLNEINQDIERIEKNLFNGMGRGLIRQVLWATYNIVDFRKTITAHKSVLRQLTAASGPFFSLRGQKDYFNDLISYATEIWEDLDNYKDTISALQQSHDSLYQWRLNEIIKTLTVFSVVIFSITFTAAVFAVANVNGMPFRDSPYNFWKTMGVIVAVGSGIFLLFKKKKWL